ncbi:MAG: HAD hydrolase family protein [Candidatus Staskawiczbacteria bacterium]|jgi:3-deoxy-D-manno-octulosonate 8-phosphate phosphatase (KDO 8-P phosphatase)
MINKNLKKKLKKIKAVAFDGDGVLFSGRVFIDPVRGEVLKERSHIDGHGISLLRAAGLRIAIVSAEKTGFLEMVGEKLNSLPAAKSRKWHEIDIFTGFQSEQKVKVIDGWLKRIEVKWEECAAMGDDLTDYQLLKAAGFAVAPAQAEVVIKEIVHYVTPREGGNGAIRDFCNLILKVKGFDPITKK